jgi:hypothetical protein
LRTGDHIPSVADTLDGQRDLVGVLGHARARVPVQHLDADRAGTVDERGVQVGPPGDRRVRPAGAGEREPDLVARGPAHDDVVDPLPRRNGVGLEAEALQQAQRPRRQPVAADLVAREARLVHHHHVVPGAGEGDGGRGAGRAGADDDHVGGTHQGRNAIRGPPSG